MLLAVALAVVAPPGATLAAVQRLPTAAAGELVLQGQDHEPIVEVVPRSPSGLQPSGSVELELVERAVAGPSGCSKRRWTAKFLYKPGEPAGAARLSTVRTSTEIALSKGDACLGGQYVRLNPGIEEAMAFEALNYLRTLSARAAPVGVQCVDETSSRLCASVDTMRDALAEITPWAVGLRDGHVVLWLGLPGQVVTEVSYPVENPSQVSVKRAAPAPA